ncbi:MAG TPA: helix-turn-helix transcriptional regulator [Pseudonocardiaceae bacterium]|nr:helix-turn-helix transcriptional regulator [Pseudonocardiaceae bacterium]
MGECETYQVPWAGIGERIAVYRRRRGLSQAALAGLIGRSESWLSQVERGISSVDRLSVLLDIARILHVDVESLIGRPWQLTSGGVVAQGLDAVRQVLTQYDHLVGEEAPNVPSLPELRTQVATLHQDYQAARYEMVVHQLPDLITLINGIPRIAADERRGSLCTYVSAYVGAAKLLTKFGVSDLAVLAADRAATIAVEADSLGARGMAAYQVVCAQLRDDRTDEAERLAVRMAETIQRSVTAQTPVLMSVAGALWLIAAVAAARRTDRAEAWARLDAAERLAELLGEDANHAWTAFGPTNVRIHRVSVAAELGDPGEALRVAVQVDSTRLAEGLRSRRAQVSLDLAWAQAQRRRDAEATLHLLEAERAAPEVIRYNAMVSNLLREMHARARRPNSVLHDLAVRAGVLV